MNWPIFSSNSSLVAGTDVELLLARANRRRHLPVGQHEIDRQHELDSLAAAD